jgi:hypothetical protein
VEALAIARASGVELPRTRARGTAGKKKSSEGTIVPTPGTFILCDGDFWLR